MLKYLHVYQIALSLTVTLAKNDIDLPPCPQHLQFLPQQLPMHCRLPRNTDAQSGPYPMFQNAEKQELPFQLPPFPGLPGMMPGMPQGLPPGMAPGLPPGMQPPGPPDSPPGMPKGMPMPMPMPMPIPVPGSPPHKMPVIVMPFYSQDRQSFKKPSRHSKHSSKKQRRRPHHHDESRASDDDEDSDDTSDSREKNSREGWWKPPRKGKGNKKYGIYRRSNSRHHNTDNIRKKKGKVESLTPILQYVTKNGYVVFEKKITKNEANNWLGPQDQAKAKEEINFKKRLETEFQGDPEDEDFPSEEVKKSKGNQNKSEEAQEGNEVNEMEESKTESSQKTRNPKRFGSLLGGSN